MAFEIGERVHSSFWGPGTVTGPLTRDEEDREPFQLVNYDTWGEQRSRIAKLEPYTDPKPRARKTTDVQRLLQADPEALKASKKYGPRIFIYCQPSYVTQEATRLGIDEKYIKPTSELSHGAKFDILFSDPVPMEMMARLASEIPQVDFQNNRICSRTLAVWLMDEGITPETIVN